MTIRKTNTRQSSRNEDHGKQGFASMSKEKVQEIASKGGQSHGKNHNENENSTNREDSPSSRSNKTSHEHHGKQGFASMPKEQVKEIASKGGQSHGKSHDLDNSRNSK